MVEVIRSIRLTVTIDTTKQTITESFTSVADLLAWLRDHDLLETEEEAAPTH